MVLPFVVPALSAAQGLTTAAGIAIPTILGGTFLSQYLKGGRLKTPEGGRMSRLGLLGPLPGSKEYKEDMKQIDTAFTPIGAPSPSPSPGLDLARPKPFAMTSEGQFERYFKTPEMDQYFGAESRGQGAPADAAAMEVLGNQLMAPKGTNIASMYAAQSAMGRVNQAAIQEMYKDRPDLQKWAAANPMLAQREYLKSEQRRASEMPTAPDQETVMGDLGSRAQDEGGYSLEAYGLPVREKVAQFLGKK
jgi:hypothetical protein